MGVVVVAAAVAVAVAVAMKGEEEEEETPAEVAADINGAAAEGAVNVFHHEFHQSDFVDALCSQNAHQYCSHCESNLAVNQDVSIIDCDPFTN